MEFYDYIYDYENSTFDYSDMEFLCTMNDTRKFTWVFIPVFYSIITVTGIIGNGLVVLTYSFYKKVKSMTDMYLMNLAIADILFVVILPFWAAVESKGWVFGNIGCKVLDGVYRINFYSGMLLLAVISIDRYIAIVHATKSFNNRGKALVYSKIICIAIWVAGIVASLPTFIFGQMYKFNTTGEMVCDIRYPKNYSSIGKMVAPTVQLTLGFFVPLLIMIFCYSLIINTLLQARNFQRHKAFRVVMAVVVAFVICQVPYNVIELHVTLFKTTDCELHKPMTIVRTVTRSLAFFHCCLNPILYAFIGVKFRFYFTKIIQDIWCLSKKYITFRHSPSRRTSETFVSRRTSDFDIDNPSSFTM
ncbi:C-C chemokine receptor type 6a [Carcharodon carcharias]|uniref:C-C chemokine receptor type 6a n=1 Tax=Carcharodon carcharias TaxID=13397 RepID=UPI001B7E1E32|nr:C-C chemokine receptor type 6a [Carcharodon carcharias]XP_041061051.1 C-C chemokine receptor type 6a [Carcharodon carcharias]XP_041061059.1 C-C chemokine receptor type 6a [Carcharodon carcharias]XP_041061065.1 C-C chemokine receptor type 6a [Carcharodon carcharias]XP_041061072.1 C-C chemokine receptor type 6a [Carcharodon carcharias]XP_041061080.1 C-C chemokine receptor type 6a [Carcharodon carcharias]XP_041061088.1 C-C chemokine receptor type 6a [Carcharodon carcharias]XP_041061097.1 C-C